MITWTKEFTVSDLRKALAHLPDDTPLFASEDVGGNGICACDRETGKCIEYIEVDSRYERAKS